MEVFIETPRLIIRPLEMTDDVGMFAMDNDPEVHKYVGGKPTQTIEAERDVIAFVCQQYIDNGIGRWAIEEKATGDFVGWTGFKLMKVTVNGHTDFIDFGYRLTRKHWGKGYGSEASIGSFEYGIDRFKYPSVYAMTDPENAASRRILEKTGLKFVGLFPYDAESPWRNPGEPTTWFEWHAPR